MRQTNPLKGVILPFVFSISNLLLFGVGLGQTAGDYQSVNTGDWSAAETWEVFDGSAWHTATVAPNYTNGVVTIRNGHTVNVKGNETIDQTIVESGGVLIMGIPPLSTGVVLTIVDGIGTDFIVNGTVSNYGKIVNTISGVVIGTIEFNTNSTYEHSRNGGYIPIATWSPTSTCKITGFTNSQISGFGQTFGNFTWDCSQPGAGYYDLFEPGMSIAGNFTVNQTGVVSSSTNINSHNYIQLDQSVLNIGGDLILNGGVLRVGVKSSATSSSSTYNIKGSVLINGGTLLFTNVGNPSGILNIAGDFSLQKGQVTTWSNTIAGSLVFTGTSNQIYTAKETISSKINFTVNSGSTLQMADENTFVRGIGYFNLMAGATLGITSPDGIYTGTVNKGNIVVTGTRTYDPQANYIYNGNVKQSTGNGLASAYNLKIDNSAGVVLDQSVSVSGALALSMGELTTTSTILLTLNDGASVNGGSASSYVNGPLKKLGNERFRFPVGKNNRYRPIEISEPEFETDAFTAEYFPLSTVGMGNITSPGLNKVSDCEYWKLESNNEQSSVDVTLFWDRNDDCNGQTFFSDPSTLVIAHSSNNNWNTHGGLATSSADGGLVTWEKLSEFGVLTLGTTLPNQALPVHFSNIEVNEKATGVEVAFTNLTESDVAYYEIERSVGGQLFYVVKRVNPVKNDFGMASYLWFDDNSLEGKIVYRIKAVETSGKLVYSKPVCIKLDAKNTGMNVFARSGQVIGQIGSLPAGKYMLRIVNVSGQVVNVESINHAGGAFSQLSSIFNAKKGVYIYNIQGPVQMQKKFVVR
jgi:hypothetical protein